MLFKKWRADTLDGFILLAQNTHSYFSATLYIFIWNKVCFKLILIFPCWSGEPTLSSPSWWRKKVKESRGEREREKNFNMSPQSSPSLPYRKVAILFIAAVDRQSCWNNLSSCQRITQPFALQMEVPGVWQRQATRPGNHTYSSASQKRKKRKKKGEKEQVKEEERSCSSTRRSWGLIISTSQDGGQILMHLGR